MASAATAIRAKPWSSSWRRACRRRAKRLAIEGKGSIKGCQPGRRDEKVRGHGWGVGMGRASAAARAVGAAVAEGDERRPGGRDAAWTAPKGAKPAYYVVLRDGKSLGKTTRTTYTDSKVKPGTTYRYTRARATTRASARARCRRSVRVKVPKARRRPLPAPTTNPVAADRDGRADAGAAVATPRRRRRRRPAHCHADARLRRRRRDPDAADPIATYRGDGRPAVLARRLRPDAGPARRLDGRSQAELVDWFLNTPQHARRDEPRAEAPSTAAQPIDPLRLRRRARARVDRPHAARDQPAARPARVLLAPPLGDQPRRRRRSRSRGRHAYRDRLLRYSDFAATRRSRSASSPTR